MTHPLTHRPQHPLAATSTLTLRNLRQERAGLSAWILGQGGFTALVTAMSAAMPAEQLRDDIAFMAGNPGLRLTGIPHGVNAGSYTMVRSYLPLAVLAALMNIHTIVRNTRRSEEEGRTELLTSAPVGRHAPAAAAGLVALLGDILLICVLALAMISAGQPVLASLTAAGALGAVGLAFAGVAAITAHLAATTRGAWALAGSALAVAVLTCAIGNLTGQVRADGLHVECAWPVWFTPVGWGQEMHPFDGGDPRPLALFAFFVLACALASVVMTERRDLGLGLLPPRRGRPRAPWYLRGPVGLALFLHRGAILGWSLATAAFALILGAAAEQMDDLSGSSLEWYARLGGTPDVEAAFQSSMVQMAGMLITSHTVHLLLHLRSEEENGHAQFVLTGAVSRTRWAGSHLLVATMSAASLLCLFGLALGAGGGTWTGQQGEWIAALVPACLAQLPSCLMTGAIVTALVALVPRYAAALSWGILPVLLLIGPLFGPDLGLPWWVVDLSPFTHLPQAPAAPIRIGPLSALVAASAGVTALALAALRHRDLQGAG